MPRASRLTPYEKGIIDGCTLTGMSQRLIGLKIGRYQCVISNYSRLKEKYGKLYSSDRPTVLSDTAKRHIIWDCSNKITAAGIIKANLDLQCGIRTVQRVIAAAPNIQRKTFQHISDRLSFAKKHMSWNCYGKLNLKYKK